MHNVHIFTLVALLLIFLISTKATQNYYLFSRCNKTTTYTTNNTFQANLNILFSTLSLAATQNKGFYNSTIGHDSQNSVYGLYLCRGDDTTDVCQECVATATKEIVKSCPNEKKAVIWYNECMVRYSDRSFFGIVDAETQTIAMNTEIITEPTGFLKQLEDIMNDLANQATSDENSSNQLVKGFAAKRVDLTKLQSLYGLVQCTLDISMADCNWCLRTAISTLSDPAWRVDEKKGGRVLTQSCNIRFEPYKFYREPEISPLPSPLPGDGRFSVKIMFVILTVCVFIVILITGFCYVTRKRRKSTEAWTEKIEEDEITRAEAFQFDLATVQAASNNFAANNKIGEGGFGEVFQGVLPSGQKIAVKRLSKCSGQGEQEFRNEVVIVAKLLHKNLARLIGFCLQEEEKILIYQYLPNKSLDDILFDPERQRLLNWSRRYRIIVGIARGLLYLHEHSRIRVIHRDLKASNILLDDDMNAKISDFGMTRIFGEDQIQANTKRIVGTYGYMSPEYAMYGQFSVKSDVFSFGVLVLEIISGKKNSFFHESDRVEDLLSLAWKQWKKRKALELMDPILADSSYSKDEVIRCINIGLLCVQDDMEARPSMESVVTTLTNYTVTISLPQPPPFFVSDYTGEKSTSRNSILLSVDDSSITEIHPR